MNPSMPSGAVLNQKEWSTIADLCRTRNLWLIYNAAMEKILYDDLPLIHPATLPGMAEQTITLGSVSKEYRMIGWRIGWVVGQAEIMSDIARVHIYNVVSPTGIAQAGAEAALRSANDGFTSCLQEWQRRRDVVLDQLRGLPVVPPNGGWSMLLNVGEMGFDSFAASRLLLERGKIAATPMKDWGEKNSDQFVRLVFSNEPVNRLSELRPRVDRALIQR
jgi:aspartate/methionine/tyrosine aminotransferase